MIYQLDWLINTYGRGRGETCEINGRWVPCRPLSAGWDYRIKAAWAVLTGRADAFVWPEGQ